MNKSTAGDLLDRAIELLMDVPTTDDPEFWHDYYLYSGNHMICSEEGWEPGEAKQSYLDEHGPESILDEVNAPTLDAISAAGKAMTANAEKLRGQTELPSVPQAGLKIPEDLREWHNASKRDSGAIFTGVVVAEFIERIAKSEAREAELKAQLKDVLDRESASAKRHDDRMEALERSHKALLKIARGYLRICKLPELSDIDTKEIEIVILAAEKL